MITKNKKIIIVPLQVSILNFIDMSKESEFYEKLRQSLLETTEFPTKYMFKFIIPTDKDKFKTIEEIFNMNTPEEIIEKYKQVSKVEGVISL